MALADKDILLDTFSRLDPSSSGQVGRRQLVQIFSEGGLDPTEIEVAFERNGWTGEVLPYGELVNWLFAPRTSSKPGGEMAPIASLASVPADAQREVVLQTLVVLLAAASWGALGRERGRLWVQHTGSTEDSYIGLSIEGARQGSAAESADLATLMTQCVRKLIAKTSIDLEVCPPKEAAALLQTERGGDCAALVASLTSCEAVGLHCLDVGCPSDGSSSSRRFRTPAVAAVCAPSELGGVSWELHATATPGEFQLNARADLHSLAAGTQGSFGPPPLLQLSATDCNKVAKLSERTRLALQAEAVHENSLADLSARIVAAAERKPLIVVVAGPSSSGKTTFSCRLALHIQARGFEAKTLECDMYFKARADPTHPRDEGGELNYEVPDSLRLDRIKEDLAGLMSGKSVELPSFDFKTGTVAEKSGRVLQLQGKAVLIIEGIFGLHPRFLSAFSDVSLFKVLIGPWSGARLGGLHVIPERKLRLLRRIGRDVRSRGVDAGQVMHKFTSVSIGEAKNIFPYASSADAVFDSALQYELPALKATIGEDVEGAKGADPEVQARRAELANYLSWVHAWPQSSYSLLPSSIACEFLGGSVFG